MKWNEKERKGKEKRKEKKRKRKSMCKYNKMCNKIFVYQKHINQLVTWNYMNDIADM